MNVKLTLLSFCLIFNYANAGEIKTQPTKYIDVLHSDLSLKPNWKEHTMNGEAILTLTPYFHSTDSVVLDAKNLKVSKVELALKKGKFSELKFSSSPKKLTIRLDKIYTNKDTFKVKITYLAVPDSIKNEKGDAITDNKGLYFINTDGKKKDVPTHLWTQGETEANSAWFPTIDHPSEKHTQVIKVTYEDKYVSLSNGKLTSTKKNKDGTKTDIWVQKLPHAVYLSVIVIGDFKIVKDKWKDKEVSYYMEPKYEQMARPIFGRTPEMIEFFSKKLGVTFPWDKYSQVIIHEYVSGAMENTSAVTFNTMFQKDSRELVDANDDETVAHELFHHWFGDLVTCESWAHLTLNESFANYSEYLWYEYKYGKDEAENHWIRDMSPYFSSASRSKQSLIRYDYDKPDDMFDVISYNKGGKILHQLRVYLGDDAFFKSLNLYLTRHAYKTAEYTDLKQCFEEVSGEDLDWYFDQWYLKGGHPMINTSYKKSDNSVSLFINQKHNFDTGFVYRLPLDIDIYTGDAVIRKRIVLDKVKDTFVFDEKDIRAIVVDASNSLVGQKNESKPIEDWIHILKNSTSYADHYNAIKKFKNHRSKDIVQSAIYEALDYDKPRTVREAIRMIDDAWLDKEPRWNEKLVEIAKTGKRGGVMRAAALEKIGDNKKLAQFKELAIEKLSDSSYFVENEALQLYSKIDSAAALQYAKTHSNSTNFGILNTAFGLISKTNDARNLPLFESALANTTGFKKMAIYNNMAKLIPLMPKSYVEEKITEFEKLAVSKDETDAFLGSSALNVMKADYAKKEDPLSKELLKKIEDILKNIKDEDDNH